MTQKLQVRTVRLELLRPGPPHNQLLSPLTQYLAICGDSGAGVVQLPYEHATFERRLAELRYGGQSDDRLATLRITGVDVARLLAAVPGLPGSLGADSDTPGTMIHLRITLSASELALLPFELSKVPTTRDSESEAWLALQTKPPVCITRHVRTVSSDGIQWPTQARILFVAGPPSDIPFDAHRRVLESAIAPFRYPKRDDPTEGVDARHTQYGERLTIIENASLDDVVTACRLAPYTHVHVLAHGAVDATSKGRPFGLKLRGRKQGVDIVSGERFASALSRVDGARIHRPSVVSVASCDSGLVASVVEPAPGASFAHTLHQSGIPLVVASQFPLTKDGSVTVASILYQGLLCGDNPWVLLHQLRSELHSRYGNDSHDWASLVVYEALPADILDQLETVRYSQGKLRLDAALERVDLAVSASINSGRPVPDVDRLEADVRSATEALPQDGTYEMECRGLEASAMKRLAQAAYLQAKSSQEPEPFLGRSCDRLEDALVSYNKAGAIFLRNDAKAAQRVATLHWVLVQELSLRAVLRERIDQSLWGAAFLAATSYLDHPSREERAWAHASLAELWLLKLATGMPDDEHGGPSVKVFEHLEHIAQLYPNEDSFPIRSTRKQLRRYLDWWVEDRFAAFAQKREHRTPWQNSETIITTATEALGVLRARVRGSGEQMPERPATATATDAPVEQEGAMLQQPPATAVARRRRSSLATALLEIHMLPAQYGDCLWMEYGTDPRAMSRVLIDCGTARTSGQLLSKTERLPASERSVELFVLTHIDDDHIGGAIPFMEAEMGGLDIREVWFNGYKHLSEVLGAVQGERFSTLIERRGLAWNKWRDGGAIVADDHSPCILPGGLTITLLSPTADKLEALRMRWEKEVTDKGLTPGQGVEPEDLLGSAAEDSTDVDELASRPFKSDRAAPNGSSIALLAEFEGKSVLFAADAHPPVVEASVRKLLEARRLERLPLDAFKVSHHASHSNTSPELLDLVDCSRYLISTNGERFQHPHRETISRIIKHSVRPPQFLFNYVSKLNNVWARPDLQERYGYSAVYPESADGLVVKL
jgi:CHAT domain